MLRIVGLLAMAVGAAVAAIAWSQAPGLDRTPVSIDIHYSRFAADRVQVPLGVPVTIVIVNSDPIDHEWIVGDASVHERHRTGVEPVHGARATEVSVPAGETRTTVVTFTSPGPIQFVCHLPGHEAYGMVGRFEVIAG